MADAAAPPPNNSGNAPPTQPPPAGDQGGDAGQGGGRFGNIDASAIKEQGIGFGLNALSFLKNADMLLPIGVLLILGMLLIPLPTWLLDLLFSFSITSSVIVLMTVIFVEKPIRLSSFPSILLLAALLRLGLNVASTRLILSDGHTGTQAAGLIIESFGEFVAGGNYVIGLIVFAILVIINFIVITKGAGRIAEVAARFALDALPGKQMAIDAELTSGHITDLEATQKRKELGQESAFFGSMDGASKFVRGDAVAGLLITFINIIGGIIIGVVQRDMDVGVAAQNYTLLTIGDGLVSQIPGLIISIGAGLLVTKAGVEGNTEKTMGSQLSANPLALIIASGLLFLLAAIPGLPSFPFLLMALLAAGIGAWVIFAQNKTKKLAEQASETARVADQRAAAGDSPQAEAKQDIGKMMAIDQLRIELGYGLLPMANSKEKGAALQDRVEGLRNQIATQFGFIIPLVRMQDNLQLPSNEYVLNIKEIEAGRGELRPNMLLCIANDGRKDTKFTIRGEKTTEPTYGLPGLWIRENQRDEAVFQGYSVVDPVSVITTHLSELITQNMADLLTHSGTQTLVDNMSEMHSSLLKDTFDQNVITISWLQKILQALLRERVSIRDLPLIIEAASDAIFYKQPFIQSVEYVRGFLSRQICHDLRNERGMLSLIVLGSRWEDALHNSLSASATGEVELITEPRLTRDFIQKLTQAIASYSKPGQTPILLVSSVLRPHIRSLIFRHLPHVAVLSHTELHPSIKFETVGQVD